MNTDEKLISSLVILIIILCILLIAGMGIDYQKPEIEQSRYSKNTIVDDISMETYNRSYNDLNNSEKEHIVRMYRIKDYFKEEETTPQVYPVFIPT